VAKPLAPSPNVSRLFHSLNRDQRLIFLSSFLWGFGLFLFNYIQPLYISSLGATPEQIGLTLSLSGVVVTLAYIPIGLWADRRGRKPVILAGWGMGALATLLMALAPDWRWLIPGLALYLFSNFAVPAMNGYITAADAGGNPTRMFAILSSGSAVGSIIAPAVGGWIGEHLGLRAVYFCAALIFGLSTLALVGLTDRPAPSPAQRGDPRQVLRHRPFLWQILFIFLIFFALELGQVLAPKYLEDVRGLTVGQIGRLGTVAALGITLSTLTYGRSASSRALALSQLAALAATLILVSSPLLLFITLAYFIHGSNRVVRPILLGRLARTLDSNTLSFGFGFQQTAMQLGLTLAPYLAGQLYDRAPAWPLYAGSLALCATILLTFILPVGQKVTDLSLTPDPSPGGRGPG